MQLKNDTTIQELFGTSLLSTRAYRVCKTNGLTDISSIFKHYKLRGDFNNFKNSGHKTNIELIDICEKYKISGNDDQIISKNDETFIHGSKYKIVEVFKTLDAQGKKVAEHTYKNLSEKLSTRSRNIVTETLEGINLERFLDNLKKLKYGIVEVRSVGDKTLEELECFLKDIARKIEEYLDSENIGAIDIRTFIPKSKRYIAEIFDSLNFQERKLADQKYQNLLAQLSVRAQNVVTQTLQGTSLELFVHSLNQIDFNFEQLKNAGQKTVGELQEFVQTVIRSLESDSLKIEKTDFDLIQLQQQFFINICSSEEVETFLAKTFAELNSGNYPLLEFADLIIRNCSSIRPQHRELLITSSGFYKTESGRKGHKDNALGLTKERIRQLFANNQIHLKALNQLEEAIKILLSFGLIIPESFVLNGKDFYKIKRDFLNTETSFTNKFLIQLLAIVNPSYQTLDIRTNDSKDFFLIKKSLLESFDVLSFFNKIEEITNERTDKDFEISLAGFVYQFLKKDINWEEQKNINATVESLILEICGLFPENGFLEIKRNTKKHTWEYIYEILKEIDKPCHVKEIAKLMNKMGIDVEPGNVRAHTLRMNDIFVLVGQSTYGLKEWENQDRIAGGTIKQVIVNFLEQSEEPKHVFEIGKHVMKYRDTNVYNIYRNIQLDPQKKYKPFGNMFYGLTDKKYDLSVTLFNRVNRNWFDDVQKLFGRTKSGFVSKETLIDYLSKRYSVKPVQIEYLIEERKNKGQLIETKDQLLKLK